MARSVEVSILNQNFSVETEAETEHVDRVAGYVEKKLDEIKSQTQTASSLQIALLCCLNIAEEYLTYHQANESSSQLAEKKIKDILDLVESTI